MINPGFDFLDYEIPWIVPESLLYIDQYINQNDTALDLGSGGSTIYFLKKCRKVYAIESEKPWYDKVSEKIKSKNLQEKLNYIFASNEREVCTHLDTIEENITIATVDTMKGLNRSVLLDKLMQFKKKPDIIVLDNWAAKKLFRSTWSLTSDEIIEKYDLQNYSIKDFYNKDWLGNGTRILINNQRL